MLNFILGERGTGKSHEVLSWLYFHQPGGYVLVQSSSAADYMADRLADRFHLPGQYRDLFVTPEELNTLRGKRNVSLAIDNLDIVLPLLLGIPSTPGLPSTPLSGPISSVGTVTTLPLPGSVR